MKAKLRQKLIARILEREGYVDDLLALVRAVEEESDGQLAGVRRAHVERDLIALEQRLEQVYRAPDGHYLWIPAIYHGTDFGGRLREHVAEKEAIARYVVEREIAPARARTVDCLFVDSGSTGLAVAREMARCRRDWRGLPVFTHSIAAVRWLMRTVGVHLELLGGPVDAKFAAVSATDEMIARIQAIAKGNRLMAVLGVNGVFEKELFITNMAEAESKKTLLQYAGKVVVACEGDKLGNKGGAGRPFGKVSDAGKPLEAESEREGRGTIKIVTTKPAPDIDSADRKRFETECTGLRAAGCDVDEVSVDLRGTRR